MAKSPIFIAEYKHEGNKTVAVYAQDESAVLHNNHVDRENEPGKFEKRDLDMGFKFASIPRIQWLRIQQLGIADDPIAIIKYLQVVKANEGKDYFTTKKRLI